VAKIYEYDDGSTIVEESVWPASAPVPPELERMGYAEELDDDQIDLFVDEAMRSKSGAHLVLRQVFAMGMSQAETNRRAVLLCNTLNEQEALDKKRK